MEQKLTFNDCANLIASQDTRLSWLVRGEIGIGKSSMAGVIAALLTQSTGLPYRHLVLDCANLSEGDLCIPMPLNKDGVLQTVYAPNEVFGCGSQNPIVLLLDEYTKASKPLQDALNPILEARRVGGYELPQGSVVVATGNLTQEAVGDKIAAHTLNRVVNLEMRKPTSDEWMEWALQNGIAAEVIAFVRQFPTCFQSWTDGSTADNNTYIHNPKHPERTAFVTPRSLERASWLINKRTKSSGLGLFHALCGTAGEAFARDMTTLLTLSDQLPPLEEALAKPTTCKVPTQGVAQLMLGLNLIRVATSEQVDAMLTYVEHFHDEICAVLFGQMFNNPENALALMTSKRYVAGAGKLKKYFGQAQK